MDSTSFDRRADVVWTERQSICAEQRGQFADRKIASVSAWNFRGVADDYDARHPAGGGSGTISLVLSSDVW